ncbi:Uncharacterized protein EN45_017280 [Penicillium chrysogenum]|uniref:Uncharacterized protein n=1 Tax=Penicillium chrysogenum TaxID=5076 RepID=A0A167WFI5_PENCH|nr:Uncharacterized protein EN45_017280 [Penicillium chrysogenum]
MSWLAKYANTDEDDNDNLGVDWVLQYEFGDIDPAQAITEFRTLIHDLNEAGLRVQVRHGHGEALLVCIRVPRDHLGNLVHQSRIKDWLFGITHTLPDGDETAIADADTPSEEIRSVYHAVTWQKKIGGAGITPGFGKWKNITASFPLHDQEACAEMLRQWSRKTVLTTSDLDAIRALFGEKVLFQLGSSLRWDVKGVGQLKVNRKQYVWEKEVKDPISGQVKHVFPGWKQFTRQLLLIPFASVASVALGALIVASFASEVFISEVYDGPFKGYLEFVPTVLFSLSLPAITSFLTSIATRLTDYENYRTQDQYDLAQTQKNFVMNFITSFLPTILTAYVYVPFGKQIVPYLDILRRTGFRADIVSGQKEFEVDTSRFQQEVIYLSMTAQVLSFGEEIVLPYVKHVLRQKWQNYRDRKAEYGRKRSHSTATGLFLVDSPEEAAFMTRLRSEAGAEEYHVEEDIMEMCVQFGYLALFGVAWPLVPLGFLLNNWLELRGDFFKLTLECQRPPPIRSDSIGPCLLGLDLLAWLGTLSTAAIVHVYRGPISEVRLSSLLLTLFVAEQVYLGMRFTASTALEKIFSDTIRREEARRYAVRKNYLAASLDRSSSSSGSHGSPNGRTRHRVRFNERVNVYSSIEKDPSTDDIPCPTKEEPGNDVLRGSDREAQFWSAQSGDMADAGVKLIRALSTPKTGDGVKSSKEA